MGRRLGLRLLVTAAALAAGLAVPAAAAAHPLGNFTINHYAGLTISAGEVRLDVIIDMAEIPAFQERQRMDADSDGSVADDEASVWAETSCRALVSDLRLARDGQHLDLAPGLAAVAFPPGAGGLSTLRLECRYQAAIAPAITTGSHTLTFGDGSYRDRIGWHEVIATGDGTILDTHGLPATSPSQKLTSYPADLVATPLDIREATIDVRRDPARPPASLPVAPAPAAPVAPSAAAVPGGIGGELPEIFRSADLTPFVVLASLLTAVVIGAGHALTPGHGKTLMAAYLVGSRGTSVHAVGLGLSVAVSHTLGILALALVILGAGSILPPDLVYRITPVIAAVSIVAIGGWMLIGEVRRRRAVAVVAGVHHDDHDHGSGQAHGHEHPNPHEGAGHGQAHEHPHEHDHEHEHEHEHDHGHGHGHAADHGHEERHDHDTAAAGVHSHGGITHSHLPAAGSTLTWRGLFVLGLAGGLIPSTSALIILLGSIAAGRPAFGLVLVIAFGLGMAAVMTGVGLVMIFARSRLDRMPSRSSLGRLAAAAPLLASVAVLALGLYLTWQAVGARPVL